MKLTLNTYEIIQRAIEEGIELGWKRAHKYEPQPTKEIVIENLVENIMNTLDEVINFDKNK